MNNSIILYKLPFTHSSASQPYFMSENARDNFLNNCQKYEAPLNDPNIFIGRSFDLSFVYPIDISIADDYNFVVVTYNNTKYFAYVIDCEMTSIGYTRFFCKRSFLFEIVNYLSHFESFNIFRFTIPYEKYYKNCKYYLPSEIRYEKYTAPLKFSLKDDNSEIRLIPCYIVNCTQLPSPNKEEYNNILNGEIPQYTTFIIPIPFTDASVATDNIIIKYNIGNGFGKNTDYRAEAIRLYDNNGFADKLNRLSPYIINMSTIVIPCKKTTCDYNHGRGNPDNPPSELIVEAYELPFTCAERGLILEQTDEHTIWASGVYRIRSNNKRINSAKPFDSKYPYPTPYRYKIDLSTVIDKKGIELGKLHLYFGSLDNELIIDLNRYSNKSGIQLNIEFWYTITVNGVTLHVSVTNNGKNDTWEAWTYQYEGIGSTYSKIYTYSLPVDDTFIISSEAKFNAENRYYNALCSNAIRANAARGLVNSASEIVTGGAQIGMHADIMGVSNISRGLFGIADTFIQNSFQSKQYELQAKQSKESPSEFSKSSEALSYNRTYGGVMFYILELPCENDYDNFINRGKIYGFDCNIYTDNLISELANISEFSFIGTAVPKGDILGNVAISEMNKYMALNILYKIYR